MALSLSVCCLLRAAAPVSADDAHEPSADAGYRGSVTVPAGYEEAWREAAHYDTVAYRLMQLGLGITKGAKVVLPVEGDLFEYPPIVVENDLFVAFLYTLHSQKERALFGRDSGAVVAVFTKWPFAVEEVDFMRGHLFGEYAGICEALQVPLVQVVYLSLEGLPGISSVGPDGGRRIDQEDIAAIDRMLRQGE